MTATITLLPGDGVGPEVSEAARRVLDRAAARFGLELRFEEAPVGGCAIDETGVPLPDATLAACERAEAILLGAVGGPRWSDPSAPLRPEQGLLALRRHFGLFANLRPVRVSEALIDRGPLRTALCRGVDLLVVRELTGGIYFGERSENDGAGGAFDTMRYTRDEVERIARVAFDLARGRRRRVTSVDKANVLAAMRLWRRTVSEVAADYPDVELEHLLVDACAMALITDPRRFDVVLTPNCFGDILSDEAAVLAGSLGTLPSASLRGDRFGLYEPAHGSAPDIAGRGIANPTAAILSAAMLLRHSLGRDDAAAAVEAAVAAALAAGPLTPDLAGEGTPACSTAELTAAVVDRI